MKLCEIVNRDGRRRTIDLDDPMNEPLRDGERLHVPTMFADTAGELLDDFTITDADRQRAFDARNEFIERLTAAWQGSQSRSRPITDGSDPYGAYVRHLENAWRGQ